MIISKIIKFVKNNYFLSDIEKQLYISFSIKSDINNSSKKSVTKKILVQTVEDHFYFGLFGAIISSMNKENNIYVEQYVPRNLTLGSSKNIYTAIKSFIFYNKFFDQKWIKLYSAYANNVAYRHTQFTGLRELLFLFKAYNIWKNIITKEDLLKLKIDSIYAGDLIYDSYLRFKPAPTVDIKDIYLLNIIFQSIKNIYLADQYIKNKKPDILMNSYSTYIQHGIPVRVALSYGVKVYTFGNYQTLFKKLSLTDFYHTASFSKYKTDFSLLENQELKLEQARTLLELRLKGKIDQSVSYMKESAYVIKDKLDNNLQGSIILFLHDFFDSPHVYGSMIFNDFLEWVEETIKFVTNSNIDFYIKPHPNQLPESNDVVNDLKNKYPNVKFISSKITNKQLVDAGISLGVSVYGTVAHELTYLNIPVILCGNNPHSSYNFCYEAKNKSEYFNFLRDFKDLKVSDEAKTQVESFVYMHNKNYFNEQSNILNNIIQLRKFDRINSYSEAEEFYNKMTSIADLMQSKMLSN